MSKVKQLESRFQNLVAMAGSKISEDLDRDFTKIAMALEDLKTNSCGCGEAMRENVVENLIKEVERKLKV